MQVSSFPKRVEIKSVLSPRYLEYPQGGRPLSWDNRKEGVDEVELCDGSKLRLISDGGQSTPSPGWVLMLTSGSEESGYRWTLYGLGNSTDTAGNGS